MSRIDQFRQSVAEAQTARRRPRGEISMAEVVNYQFELLKKAVRNLLVDNKNFKSGYYAEHTPSTGEFIRTVLPRWEEALQGKVEELQSLVARQLREDEEPIERATYPAQAVLAESDPRPVTPLDLDRPLYDEAGREYLVVNSSGKQVVTNLHGMFGVWDRETGHCLNADCEDSRLSNERPSDEWIAKRREASISLLSSMHADAAIDRARQYTPGDSDELRDGASALSPRM